MKRYQQPKLFVLAPTVSLSWLDSNNLDVAISGGSSWTGGTLAFNPADIADVTFDGSSNPVQVTGLTGGTTYTMTVGVSKSSACSIQATFQDFTETTTSRKSFTPLVQIHACQIFIKIRKSYAF